MRADKARILLGFPPCFRPTPSQVKAAYKRKVWESHPDRFPVHEKSHAECKFKLISEAYTCLQSGAREGLAPTMQVVRTGGRRNHALIRFPFLLIILGTVGLGGFNATRAYKQQKQAYPSHNPFLP
ncbi:uncharacterized protein LOC132268738 [Cornus florida]|uniref:uncharacterized protein LOC132268738 n=1 Tax=Cornus florida TaxID=4283 RepID=UPI0028993F70|nr:uncharacterized protein LOC132268738 [Cornus florida]